MPDVFDEVNRTSQTAGDPFDLAQSMLKAPPGAKGNVDLPADLPGKTMDKLLSATPFIVGTGVGLATGGMGMLPAIGASMLGGAAGAVMEQGGRKLTGIDAPKDLEDFTTKVGMGALEGAGAEIGGRATVGVVSKLFGAAKDAKRLYQSALKPAGTNEEKALKAVEGGLTHAIPLDEAAAKTARDKINQLNSSIERAIGSVAGDIPPQQYVRRVSTNLDSLRDAWKNDATRGKQFVEAIDEYERQFLIQHGNPQPIQRQVWNRSAGNTPTNQMQTVTIQPDDMTLPELRRQAQPLSAKNAQEIKKQTYETIRTQRLAAWDPDVHTGVNIQANQEIARALKDDLAALVKKETGVDISKLNAEEGGLIEFEHAAQRFLKRDANKNAFPAWSFGMGGAVLGSMLHEGNVGTAAGAFGADMFRRFVADPAVQSRLAILLYNVEKGLGPTGTKVAGRIAGQFPSGVIRVGEYLHKQKGK